MDKKIVLSWIMLTAMRLSWRRVITWAIKNGADTNGEKLQWYQKPLIWAIRNNDAPMVALLLRYGCDSQIVDYDGKTTPFNLALRLYQNQRVDFDIVQWLAKIEVNIDRPTPVGFTPLGHAVLDEDQPLIELFLELGADPNRRNDYGHPNLNTAVETGNREICELLLKHGADPNQTDKKRGVTAISVAVWENQLEIAGLLLNAGADPNHKTWITGCTPLHFAAAEEYQGFYDLLICHGANPEIQNNAGQTPSEFAKQPEFGKQAVKFH